MCSNCAPKTVFQGVPLTSKKVISDSETTQLQKGTPSVCLVEGKGEEMNTAFISRVKKHPGVTTSCPYNRNVKNTSLFIR